jgi:ABC-2 type transport system ATP-binding protein
MLRINEVSKTYQAGRKEALKKVSLSVGPGEFTALLGQNGAGKSTLINIIAGNVKKDSGTVTIGGYDLDRSELATKRMIGVVPQEIGFDFVFTVNDVLKNQSGYFGIRRNQDNIDHLLESLGLIEKKHTMVRDLSGGMKRRLLIAKAMIHQPKLLFLDEPTTGLDPQSRTAIWSYLERLNREEHITIFLTTQYLEEADKLCKRLAIVDFGKIVAGGTPAELKREIGADSIKLSIENCERVKPKAKEILSSLNGVSSVVDAAGSDDCLNVFAKNAGPLVADIVRAFDSSDIKLLSVTFSSPSLDDVFLKHTGRRIRTEDLVKAPSAMFGGRR